jgi:uncharacterized protein YwqG
VVTVDVKKAFAAWRARHMRRAWKPVCIDGGTNTARFGGSALLGRESWPACAGCRNPMQLLLQLPLASLPGNVVRGDGLLQAFYCSRDDGRCETWAPFSGAHLVRLVREPLNDVASPLGRDAFRLRSVVSWNELADYPHVEEHERLGLIYEHDFERKLVRVTCAELGIDVPDLDQDIAEVISDPAAGDKLGGWPLWIQQPEYPSCPRCARQMAFVFQIDSGDVVYPHPRMFGDGGIGHITQCPDHPDVLAFGWACT